MMLNCFGIAELPGDSQCLCGYRLNIESINKHFAVLVLSPAQMQAKT